MEGLESAVKTVRGRVVDILGGSAASIYLYGSLALGDFRPGWSDIDILVLTEKKITEGQAGRLVNLRQALLEEQPGNAYYRRFEGGMLSLDAFRLKEKDRVVYWGTSGERITDSYSFDSFSMCELLEGGILIWGRDVRDRLPRPAFDELRADVRRHYEAMRKYARETGRSFYSFGWLLDISRCLYTLRTGKIIAKTAAGEWALKENLCPCAGALTRAVEIRKEPARYLRDEGVLDEAQALGGSVQSYADVLERELAGWAFAACPRGLPAAGAPLREAAQSGPSPDGPKP